MDGVEAKGGSGTPATVSGIGILIDRECDVALPGICPATGTAGHFQLVFIPKAVGASDCGRRRCSGERC
jgi:hypothetical protein